MAKGVFVFGLEEGGTAVDAQRIWTTELAEHAGERVRLMGWLHHYRRLSEVSFIILRDKEGTAQIVSEDYSMAGEGLHIGHESVISVEGTVVAEAQAPGGYEVHAPRIEVISPALEPPVFDSRSRRTCRLF
jgi:nondiscriminating aspartyl-tRNA synthetase